MGPAFTMWLSATLLVLGEGVEPRVRVELEEPTGDFHKLILYTGSQGPVNRPRIRVQYQCDLGTQLSRPHGHELLFDTIKRFTFHSNAPVVCSGSRSESCSWNAAAMPSG
ncbi:hypothetical protein SELMODRAFT_410675 [Selaginella moellendorffii]|uniref:Uncharacterized protein n=1 Tax=Selaginella moellendorffii TaxID=88036 RepID=D8RFH6_SELML|nr:hypothetical protein SELMODRAFT_410675 [Selaginella moellendorffii]